jgi:hypothetical protein
MAVVVGATRDEGGTKAEDGDICEKMNRSRGSQFHTQKFQNSFSMRDQHGLSDCGIPIGFYSFFNQFSIQSGFMRAKNAVRIWSCAANKKQSIKNIFLQRKT